MGGQTGMYPNAHPTAPGGMSQKALAAELIERHGWTKEEVAPLMPLGQWPQLIEAVVQGRLAREREDHVASIDYNEVAYDEACMCGEPESTHHTVDPPHSFTAQSRHSEEETMTYDDDDLLAEFDAIERDQPKPLFIKDPDSYDFVFDGHAGAGPSGAERWMTCTASLQTAREFLETLSPNQQKKFAESSTAAKQGTTAHAAAEAQVRLLLGEITPQEVETTLLELTVNPLVDGEAYDEEMAEHLTSFVDLARQLIEDGRVVHAERRVEALVELPDGRVHAVAGSADLTGEPMKNDRSLVVVDLKYGEGLDVEAEENPQLRTYALGVLTSLADEEGNLPDIERIDYYVVQPRLGGIKPWSESLDDLLDWRDDVLSPALALALGGIEAGATFSPSEKACQWCPAKGTCEALVQSRFEAAKDMFDLIIETEMENGHGAVPDASLLSDERLGSVLKQAQDLVKLADELKAEAQRRLYRGIEVPGYHLVNYQPPREWVNDADERLSPALHPDEGAVALSTEIRETLWTEPVLLSPAKALAVLKTQGIEEGPEILDELIHKPDLRPVVAPVNDRRKKWEGKPPEQMFPDDLKDK